MCFESVFFGNRIFENKHFEWHESKCAIAAKNYKCAKTSNILQEIWQSACFYDDPENELTEEDCDIETQDIYSQDWFFSDRFVTIKNAGNYNNWNNQRNEFCKEIIWIVAINKPIV